MNTDELLDQICRQPESDELRLQYAEMIESTDPEHAAFIRLQIEITNERRRQIRASADRRIWPYLPRQEQAAGELLQRNGPRWVEDILKFTRRGIMSLVEFDRGFPCKIEMQPQMFIASADAVFRTAPIRHIDFVQPLDELGHILQERDGSDVRFPMDLLLACSQLERLDSLGFSHAALTGGDYFKLAQCRHLTRCVYLAFIGTQPTVRDLITLASGATTGKMLGIGIRNLGERTWIQRDASGADYLYTEFSKAWRDVEHGLGYVPWLHQSHNGDCRLDARWQFEHGGVPRFPARSLPALESWYDVPPLLLRGPGDTPE